MVIFFRRPGVIGLDIGSRRVKAVQLVRQAGGWSEFASASFDRASPGVALSVHEAEHIASVLDRRGFSGRKVVLAVPGDAMVASLLELPPKNAQVSREQLVRMEVARVHKLSPDALSCCWSDLPTSEFSGGGSQSLCWAMPHDRVAPLLSSLDAAGLQVEGMEPASLALRRVSMPMLADAERISAVADLGAVSARLVLVYQGRVVHERVLPDWGADALAGALCERWSAPEPLAHRAMQRYGVAAGEATGLLALETAGTLGGMLEEMIEQVSLSFSFVSHQYPTAELGPLLLTGGVAGMPGLATTLADGMQLQVVPLTAGVIAAGCREPLSSGLVAYGLAMKEGGSDG